MWWSTPLWMSVRCIEEISWREKRNPWDDSSISWAGGPDGMREEKEKVATCHHPFLFVFWSRGRWPTLICHLLCTTIHWVPKQWAKIPQWSGKDITYLRWSGHTSRKGIWIAEWTFLETCDTFELLKTSQFSLSQGQAFKLDNQRTGFVFSSIAIRNTLIWKKKNWLWMSFKGWILMNKQDLNVYLLCYYL